MRNIPLAFVEEESVRVIRASRSKHCMNRTSRAGASVLCRAIGHVLSALRFVFDLRHLDGPYALAQYERLQQLR
jgi:hypothetical protein